MLLVKLSHRYHHELCIMRVIYQYEMVDTTIATLYFHEQLLVKLRIVILQECVNYFDNLTMCAFRLQILQLLLELLDNIVQLSYSFSVSLRNRYDRQVT